MRAGETLRREWSDGQCLICMRLKVWIDEGEKDEPAAAAAEAAMVQEIGSKSAGDGFFSYGWGYDDLKVSADREMGEGLSCASWCGQIVSNEMRVEIYVGG